MPNFTVTVRRFAHGTRDVEVTAETIEQAKKMALDETFSQKFRTEGTMRTVVKVLSAGVTVKNSDADVDEGDILTMSLMERLVLLAESKTSDMDEQILNETCAEARRHFVEVIGLPMASRGVQ